MIVGWQIADHLRTDLVLDALEMAIFRRDVTDRVDGLVHHSDAGSQYTSFHYTDRLSEAGISASIGTVGDSYDNAMAEALNGTYQAELVLHGPWRTPGRPRDGHDRLDLLVQRRPPPWRDRRHPASRVRIKLVQQPKDRTTCPDPLNPHCIKPGVLQTRTLRIQ